MYPILFKIGPLTIHTYGVMLASAFFLGLALAIKQARKEGIPPDRIVDLSMYLIISAIVGSRLLFVLIELHYYIKHPLKIIMIWEGGLVYYGGLIFAVPVGIYYLNKNKLPIWKVADIIAPSIAISLAVGRLGCFFAGCCHGKPTHIPWAVTFKDPDSLARHNVPLHPTQIYEALGGLFIFLFLISLRKRKAFDGQLLWLYMFLYSILRFFLEFLRGDEAKTLIFGSPLSLSQGIAIPIAVLAIYMLYSLKKVRG